MFKQATFDLEGPICTCKKQNLRWGIGADRRGKIGLTISCETCGTELQVPHSKFLAGFRLKNPYPEGEEKEQDDGRDAKILKIIRPESDT